YRAGHNKEVVRTLEKAKPLAARRYEQRPEDAARLNGQGGTAWDWYFLAMAHYRLGHADEGKKWIDKANTSSAQSLDWEQRLELRLIRREAERVAIAALEARLAQHPTRFDGGLHNELRHLYG